MFTPTAQLVSISRRQDSLVLRDTTGDYPDAPDGYGSPYAPASQNLIQIVWANLTPLNGSLVKATSVTGNIYQDAPVTVKIPVNDGVGTVQLLYGVTAYSPDNGQFTVSGDGLTLTFPVDVSTLLEGVPYIGSFGGEYPSRISEVDGNVVYLSDPFNPDYPSDSTFYIYYIAEIIILSTICGEKRICRETLAMSLYDPSDCRGNDKAMELMKMLGLKLSADSNFSCNRLQKADDAAKILCGNYSLSDNTNCNQC